MKRLFVFLSLLMAANVQAASVKDLIAQFEKSAEADVDEVIADVQELAGEGAAAAAPKKKKPVPTPKGVVPLSKRKVKPAIPPKPVTIECPITLSHVKLENAKTLTACGHTFSKEGLREWLNENKTTCPLCRADITEDDQDNLYSLNDYPSLSIQDLINSGGLRPIVGGVLDLSSERISSLDGLLSVPGIQEVRMIDLSKNRLEIIEPGVFDGLNQLQGIDLSYNRLKTIEPGLFNHLNQLQGIDLSNNRLETIEPRVFDGLNQLKELSLSYNKLETIPLGLFDSLNQLEMLDLSENRLKTIELGLFDSLNQLESIDLCYNRLETIPDRLFDHLYRLEYLYFARGNPLFPGQEEAIELKMNYLGRNVEII